jgi:hypothetical protein
MLTTLTASHISPLRQESLKFILRPTVGRQACPGVRPPSGTRDEMFFPSSKKFYLGSLLLWAAFYDETTGL